MAKICRTISFVCDTSIPHAIPALNLNHHRSMSTKATRDVKSWKVNVKSSGTFPYLDIPVIDPGQDLFHISLGFLCFFWHLIEEKLSFK